MLSSPPAGTGEPMLCQRTDLSYNTVEQDVLCQEDDPPLDLLSSIQLGGGASCASKEGNDDQAPAAERGIDCSSMASNGYDGESTRNQNLDCFHSRERVEASCLASQQNCNNFPYGEASNFFSSSSSNRDKGGFFHRDLNAKSGSTGQAARNNNHSRSNEKYSMKKNSGASGDQVRGPRAYKLKSPYSSSAEKGNLNGLVRRDQYNKSDFKVKYEFAMFFMIKSYNEDDVHKSVKYNVWSSTPSGNRKLDTAFWYAESITKEKGIKCPIFLFFSVNASGQFLGLAEMVGPVDFKKNLDFWQLEKWNGFFPVKWHIVKDIPNRHFQSITLENNDNNAVTFSRDSQEIELPQGLKMLSIFKSHPFSTSILDDFEFYEKREKTMRATRRRAVMRHYQDDFNVDRSSVTRPVWEQQQGKRVS